MVKAIIDISKKTNKILNIVKAQFELKNKSLAINKISEFYEYFVLEPNLNPDFILKMQKIKKQKTIYVKDFAERYKLK